MYDAARNCGLFSAFASSRNQAAKSNHGPAPPMARRFKSGVYRFWSHPDAVVVDHSPKPVERSLRKGELCVKRRRPPAGYRRPAVTGFRCAVFVG